jgi:fructan beta-fructosidase
VNTYYAAIVLAISTLTAHVAHTADILIADFESRDYGDWKVEGEAFGHGPAQGTLPGQMHVDGFQGKGLVNSFFEGDGTTGTLTSPPLKIERDYIKFLIGGGSHEGKTCINLILDGKTVRTATGSNNRPGGSETLEWTAWDVSDLKGKSATLQIVDAHTSGWGHINVDQIVQSDEQPKLPVFREFDRTLTIDRKYLIVPIKNGAPKCQVTLEVDGKPVRRYGTELATNAEQVDWYAYFTIGSYHGQSGKITVSRATEDGFALIRQADQIPGSDAFYTEELRPQFHFSQKVGWNNDPNGMVYLDGEWHLYFQHNPVGWKWGNMTWGHAVSKNLVHWEQLPNVLFPGTMARGACFSGGAIVDKKNTAGWKTGDNDVLVAFLTDTGAGESIAYSNDNGRTFTWFEGNPVVKHSGRDPKIIWYEYDKVDTPLNEKAKQLGGHWVMVVFDEHRELKHNAAFYTSTDLKAWKEQSHLPGYFECTELFELPVDGNSDDSRWVVFAADARYAIGKFDGRTFTPEHRGKHQVHHGPYYASQTFDNSPDGRRIQIGWVRLAMPGMPFNQTFSFPHELTLRQTAEGIRMFAKPVKEIEKIHLKKHVAEAQPLTAGRPVSLDVSGRLFDVRATFEIGDAKRVGLNIGGNVVSYDVAEEKLNGAVMTSIDGRISLQVLVDRPMIEICGNDGAVFITAGRKHKGQVASIKAFADGNETGAGAKLISLEVYELQSIWKN